MYRIETVLGTLYGDSHRELGDAIRQAEVIAVDFDIDLDIVDESDDTVAARAYADGTVDDSDAPTGSADERRHWRRVDDDERTSDARDGR